MAVCALASARVRDQALFNSSWDAAELSKVPSETFYASALHVCSDAESTNEQDLNLMRTSALLSLTAIQYGDTRAMQAHLGRYHTLVAMDGLHDEVNWPDGIGIVETEERRRLVGVTKLPLVETPSADGDVVLVDVHIGDLHFDHLERSHPCAGTASQCLIHDGAGRRALQRPWSQPACTFPTGR